MKTLLGEMKDSLGEESTTESGELRAELSKKETEMTVSLLKAQNSKLKAELEGLRVMGAGGETEKELELVVQNAKLREQFEQIEEHCLTQQQLRRDTQLEVVKLTQQFEEMKEASERDMRDAIARQRTLQTELHSAQKRGIAAQRQLDGLRAGVDTPDASASTADLQGQIDTLKASFNSAEEKTLNTSTQLTKVQEDVASEKARADALEEQLRATQEELAAAQQSAAEAPAQGLQCKYNETAVVLEEKLLEVAELKAGAAEAEAKALISKELQLRVQHLERLSVQQAETLKHAEERTTIAEENALGLAARLDAAEAHTAKLQAEATSMRTDHLAQINTMQTEHLAQTEQHTAAIADLEETLNAADLRIDELQTEGDYLQEEWAKAGADARRAMQRASDTQTALEDLQSEMVRLKKDHKRAVTELRGDVGTSAALVPLPNHKGLKPEAAKAEIGGALESLALMLNGVEDLQAHNATSEQECAFMRALAHKTNLMMQGLEKDPQFAKLNGLSVSLQRRLKRTLTRLEAAA